MPKSSYDLQRQRKTYPQSRRTPVFVNTEPIGSVVLNFTLSDVSVAGDIIGFVYTTPIVTISSTDNVNVWVSNIATSAKGLVTVTVSTSAPFEGEVHVHCTEATV